MGAYIFYACYCFGFSTIVGIKFKNVSGLTETETETEKHFTT